MTCWPGTLSPPDVLGHPCQGAALSVTPTSAHMSLGNEGGTAWQGPSPGFWCLQREEVWQEPGLMLTWFIFFLVGPLFRKNNLCVETNSSLTIRLQCCQVSSCGKKTYLKCLGRGIGLEMSFLCPLFVCNERPRLLLCLVREADAEEIRFFI